MAYTDFAKDIERILMGAERELRVLVESAASKGDYAAVVEIAKVAASFRSMTGKESDSEPPREKPATRSEKRRYPFFTRNGGDLVKTGYSSSTKSDYQHRAPRDIVDTFARALDSLPKSAKRHFTMDSILPLQFGDRPVPDYQPYLVLAWFRDAGWVKKDGRVGYTVTGKKPLLEMIDAAWQNLNSD